MPVDRLSRALVPWLIAKRRAILLFGLGLFVVGGFFSARLYSHLESKIEELLPADAPSVVAAHRWGPKLHSPGRLTVVLEGKDAEGLERFADKLAEALGKMPTSVIESVDYRTNSDVAFLKKFGLFYMSETDLRDIRERIARRVHFEKRAANPLLGLADDEDEQAARKKEVPPPLDFSDLEKKYGAGQLTGSQYRNGYYQTEDGHLLALLVRPPENATGYESNKRLMDLVHKEVVKLDVRGYDPSARVGYGGEVTALVEEQEALVEDLVASTVVVLTLVMCVLYLFFRTWAAIGALLGSLAIGCAATFGISYFWVGHLNANTAFLGSIVVGNGINVSIILLARFVEERNRGVDVNEALREAWAATFAPTFIAAFAAGLAYLTLATTHFRGFNQFGIIGGLGMALCWVSSVVFLPPLVVTIQGRFPMRPRGFQTQHGIASAISDFVERRRTGILIGTGVLSLASLVAIGSYRQELIEYDITKLRAARSIKSGAIFWNRRLDEIFKAYLTPIVLVGDTPADLNRTVLALEKRRAALGAADPLGEVRTLASAIPPGQEAKLPLVQQIRAELTDARLKLLPEKLRARALLVRPPEDARPVTLEDLPKTLRMALTEKDGTAGRIALAFPRAVGTLDSKTLGKISTLVRGAIHDAGEKTEAVSQSLLFADIASAIIDDAPRATLLAFAGVVLLVVFVLRRLVPTMAVLGGLLMGVLWLLGAAAGARLKVNFLNFVVLPITFGIGVDYAVNIVQRYWMEGTGSLKRVVRETGSAVAVCSMTTTIGYASLMVADNRALAGFGMLAAIGELTCIGAALIALPAWLMGRERRLASKAQKAAKAPGGVEA